MLDVHRWSCCYELPVHVDSAARYAQAFTNVVAEPAQQVRPIDARYSQKTRTRQ